MTEWEACPVLISCTTTRRAWSIGMAKPRPMLPPWTGDQVAAQRLERRIDADDLAAGVDQRTAGVAGVDRGVGLDGVQEDLRRRRPLPAPGCTGRFTALMMPLVTVSARPSGEPKAMTGSPTCDAGRVAQASGRQVADMRTDTLSTAMSE